jgi:3-hydroxyisobutyrate dehydrogenase and related beta-hydroxyacid dehydrogenases
MGIKKIGFIGIGVMGKSMAANLLRAGFELSVYTRRQETAGELLAQGAKWQSSPAALAAEAEAVLSMVGYPADVEAIYLGKEGALAAARAGSYLVDMTTSSPALAQKIAAAAAVKGVQALDAPVSGGDSGAKNATLAIMVGGERQAYETLLPLFKAMGKTICYFGAAGSGQYAKMSNQIAIASNMMGVCEALAYAKKSGLDPEAVLRTISTGAAGSWSLANLGPRMLKGDYAPGFFIKHFIKDMRIAIESAETMELELPGLKLAKKLYDELAAAGKENLGTQALLQRYLDK